MSIKMYTTSTCGACNLVKASGTVEDLGIEVIDVTTNPEMKPKDMTGAPFFVKITEGGSVRTHVGYANTQMLQDL